MIKLMPFYESFIHSINIVNISVIKFSEMFGRNLDVNKSSAAASSELNMAKDTKAWRTCQVLGDHKNIAN